MSVSSEQYFYLRGIVKLEIRYSNIVQCIKFYVVSPWFAVNTHDWKARYLVFLVISRMLITTEIIVDEIGFKSFTET